MELSWNGGWSPLNSPVDIAKVNDHVSINSTYSAPRVYLRTRFTVSKI